MKSLFVFLLLTFVASFVGCAVYLERAAIEKGTKLYEQGFRCQSKYSDLLMKASEEKSLHKSKTCETAYCGEDGIINYLGCGAVGAGPGCTVTKTDFSKPHPHCCPSIECKPLD